jgi:hypothetical protein
MKPPAKRVDPSRALIDALSKDLAFVSNPSALYEALGVTPDEWQRRVLRSQAKRLLLLAGRQTGKSALASWLALEVALFQPPSLILICSASQRQSAELEKSTQLGLRQMTDVPAPTSQTALTLELANGSRVVSLPANEASVRGYSGCRLLLLDECSRIPDPVIGALTPSVATVPDARIVCLSTPNGPRGYFYRAYVEAKDQPDHEWSRFELKSHECPRISERFLASERLALGPAMYQQEYENDWGSMESSPFTAELLKHCLRVMDPIDLSIETAA